MGTFRNDEPDRFESYLQQFPEDMRTAAAAAIEPEAMSAL
jgi:hypothetical protein